MNIYSFNTIEGYVDSKRPGVLKCRHYQQPVYCCKEP